MDNDSLKNLSRLTGIPSDLLDIIAAVIADNDIRRKFIKAYERRTAIQAGLLEQTAHLNEVVRGQDDKIDRLLLEFYAVKEWAEGMANHIDDIQTAMYVVIGQAGGNTADRLREIKRGTRERQLVRLYKTLEIYEEQAAAHGLDVPPFIVHNIEAVKDQIAEVEKRLET